MGFFIIGEGDRCDVAAEQGELEGDIPPLVDIAQAIFLLAVIPLS